MTTNDINAEKSSTEEKADRLDNWMLGAIGIVALGLVIENLLDFIPDSGPELLAICHKVGSSLVTLGVSAEFMIELRHRKHAAKLRALNDDLTATSDTKIAKLNIEAERLRKENNDRELLARYRSVGDRATFERAMRQFSGTEYTVEFQDWSIEVAGFEWELTTYLNSAGWVLTEEPMPRPSLPLGVMVLTISEYKKPIPELAAGLAIAEWLDAREIATDTLRDPRRDLKPSTLLLMIGPRPETIGQQEFIRSVYAKRKKARGAAS